jgi:SSS family solute:Na+ symporter
MLLGWIDFLIMAIYVMFVVGIGWTLRSYMKTSSDFLTSGRSIPAWVTGLAFISANLGALELVGMAASGAKYGIATSHFYWVGAIPAMVFLAIFMMPFYYGSKARSVPEYLNMRFDYRTRCLNSISFAVMTVFASGISMNALAKLLANLIKFDIKWTLPVGKGITLGDYDVYLWICSAVVLLYVLKGGLTSAIYTEVLQFFMIVLGFAPVVYLGLKEVGGWNVLKGQLQTVASNPVALDLNTKTFAPDAWTSAWKPLLGGPSANPMGVDIFAMVFGLGFVLSFGYWCTNFLVVQRAMAAKDMGAARRTPLIAAVPKMLFPILVILPGMLAVALASMGEKTGYAMPKRSIDSAAYAPAIEAVKTASQVDIDAAVEKVAKATGLKINREKIAAMIAADKVTPLSEKDMKSGLSMAVAENDYDGVILSLVTRYCPAGLLGLALTALLASFMSGMAGNVTAFNTIWTYDLYQAYLVRNKSDAHYLWMGKAITVVGILLSIACAYFAKQYNNAMDIIQLVFGFVNAPLFATFVLGMFWVRATATGAFLGLLLGTGTSAVFHAMTLATGNTPGIKGGYIHVVQYFPSEMAQNFWLAAFAFIVCFVLTVVISLAGRQTKTNEELKGLVYSLTPKIVDHEQNWFLRPAVMGTILLIACVVLNYIFW